MELLERTPEKVQSTSLSKPAPNIRIRPHRLTLFVPSKNPDGDVPHELREQVLARCREVVCDLCGGATEWRANGSWPGQDGFVFERITVIAAFGIGERKKIVARLFKLCRWMKAVLRQEKVAFEVDSRLFLV